MRRKELTEAEREERARQRAEHRRAYMRDYMREYRATYPETVKKWQRNAAISRLRKMGAKVILPGEGAE